MIGDDVDPALARAIEDIAERAAERAIIRVLLQLGVDAETPVSLIESQKDAAWTRRVRRAAESRPAKLGLAAFGAFLSLLGGLIVIIVRAAMDGNFSGK